MSYERKEIRKRKKEKKEKRHLSDWPTGVCWKLQRNLHKLKKRPKNSLSLNSHNLGTNRPITAILGSESMWTDRQT